MRLREVCKAAPIALAIIAALCVGARSARARIAAAACVATMAAAELVWCNAASSLNAEPPGYYSVLQKPAGEDAAALSFWSGRSRRDTRRANGRAWRSSASAARGRTWPWRAGWRRPTATTRCASAATTAWSRPARPRTSSTSGCSRPRSTATTARSPASWAWSTWCSAGRSRRCRTWRAGRCRTCCWPVPGLDLPPRPIPSRA